MKRPKPAFLLNSFRIDVSVSITSVSELANIRFFFPECEIKIKASVWQNA